MSRSRVIRRLDHHGRGTDRYEVRCVCGRVIIRRTVSVRDHLSEVRCGRCCVAEGMSPEPLPTAGGAA